MRIRYLRRADTDLVDIYETVARHDPQAADRLIDRIRTSVLRLRDYPESAQLSDVLGDGMRTIPVSSYVVYYRIDRNNEGIVRVLHSARDADAAFRRQG